MRVLIVDDSAIVGERLADMFATHPAGIQVVGQAMDVPEAIQALKPDAVILGIQMPGGTGMDVLQAAKEDRPETIVRVFTN